jgi:hypothetical protein
MLRLFPAVACAACFSIVASASAQTIYKCNADGKLSYTDRPCSRGTSTALAVPAAPDPETAQRLARQNVLAAQLTKRDTARAHQEELAMQRARRAASVQKIKCDRLRLRHQWAQEDARTAGVKNRDAAQVKARRQAQTFALECPS